MAQTIRATYTSQGSGGNIGVGLGAQGMQAGDFAVALWYCSPTSTTPTGWTVIGTGTADNSGAQLIVYAKTLTSGDVSGSVTSFSSTASTSFCCLDIICFTGSTVGGAVDFLVMGTNTNPNNGVALSGPTPGGGEEGFIYAASVTGPGWSYVVTPSNYSWTTVTGETGAALPEHVVAKTTTSGGADLAMTTAPTGTIAIQNNSPGAGISAAMFAVTAADSTITATPSSPANGATVFDPPTLQVAVTDADTTGTDTVTFTLATDAGLTQNVLTFTTAAQNLPLSAAAFTATMAQLGANLTSGTYYWNAAVNPSDALGAVTTATQSFTYEGPGTRPWLLPAQQAAIRAGVR